MAPTPFRRRRKATRVARNLALAEAALAMATSRAGATGGAVKRRGGLLLAGAAVLGAGAVAVLKRDRLARALPSRSGADAGPTAAPAPPPQQSNYDAPGPVANTATPVPAPDPAVRPAADTGESTPTGNAPPTRPAIDERAEEEAAAAEAAAIGGSVSDYAPSTLDEPLDEAERPVVEAGGGVAEGQEQTEAELEDNATMRDQAPSAAERQIDEVIEAQDEPWTGETPEPLTPGDDGLRDAEEGVIGAPGTEGGGISGRPGARLDDATESGDTAGPGAPGEIRTTGDTTDVSTQGPPPETPGVPATGSAATEPRTGDEERPGGATSPTGDGEGPSGATPGQG